jgi:hypothetical protein
VVSGPLRTIISLLLDSACDRETRTHAEQVLVAIGFRGTCDLELCQFDVDLLVEWFNMKKSLKPQQLARKLLRHWIEDLFNGVLPIASHTVTATAAGAGAGAGAATAFSHSSSPRFNFGGHGIFGSGAGAAGGPSVSFDMNSSSLRSSGGAQSHAQAPSSPSGGGRLGQGHSRGHHRHHSGGVLSASLPELQRRFADSFVRYLPFCLGKTAALNVLREEELELAMGDGHGWSSAASAASASTSASAAAGGSASFVSPYGAYDGMDVPPDGVLALLEIFYPSRLQQLVLMDIFSLVSEHFLHQSLESYLTSVSYDEEEGDGVAYAQGAGDDAHTHLSGSMGYDYRFGNGNGYGYGYGYGAGSMDVDDLTPIKLPTAREVNGLLLPQMDYATFHRCGRIVERMVEEGDPLQPWSLAFRSSRFSGEFHTSLLSTLRRCSRIVSVSFAAYSQSETPTQDARMGWLVGNMPSNIRFVR